MLFSFMIFYNILLSHRLLYFPPLYYSLPKLFKSFISVLFNVFIHVTNPLLFFPLNLFGTRLRFFNARFQTFSVVFLFLIYHSVSPSQRIIHFISYILINFFFNSILICFDVIYVFVVFFLVKTNFATPNLYLKDTSSVSVIILPKFFVFPLVLLFLRRLLYLFFYFYLLLFYYALYIKCCLCLLVLYFNDDSFWNIFFNEKFINNKYTMCHKFLTRSRLVIL